MEYQTVWRIECIVLRGPLLTPGCHRHKKDKWRLRLRMSSFGLWKPYWQARVEVQFADL